MKLVFGHSYPIQRYITVKHNVTRCESPPTSNQFLLVSTPHPSKIVTFRPQLFSSCPAKAQTDKRRTEHTRFGEGNKFIHPPSHGGKM